MILNHCTLKVTKKQGGSSWTFHYKTILGSDIYTKVFLHALTGCNTTSLIDGAEKATIFENFHQISIFKKQH